MSKLEIIVASTRPGRVGPSVAHWIESEAAAHGGFDEVEVVDLAEVNLPFMNEPHHPRLGRYTHQHTRDWSAKVAEADAFVFVMPEYNYGYNAELKNAIDYLHSEWQYKPVGHGQLRRRLGGHPRGTDDQAGGDHPEDDARLRGRLHPLREPTPRRGQAPGAQRRHDRLREGDARRTRARHRGPAPAARTRRAMTTDPAPGTLDVHPVCARFHTAIELIGARWTGAILRALFTGQCRYAQIRDAVPGLSDTMLAQRLRELQREGLIERHVVPETPVRVRYDLTAKGRDLEPVIEAVITWSHTWIPLPAAPAGAPEGE